MFDDNNSREIEAALREEEELDIPDGMTPDEWHRIQEEAQAEEEFIADREDTVKPLVFGKKSGDAESDFDNESEAHLSGAPDGVMLGSGDLEVDRIGEPISNEEELRKESVNEDNNPIKDPAADDASVADSSFGGEEAVAEPSTSDPLNETENAEPVAEVEPAPAEEPAPEAPADGAVDVTPAPSADIPAVTDTPTPIPGGMPTTPVSTNAPMAAAPAEKPKKKKTGLIVGLVILLVLVIGGVAGGIAFFSWHESPEKQVSDAVNNVLTAKTLGATRAAAIESGKMPNIKMSVKGEMMPGKELSLSGEIAIKGNDTLYVKMSGLKDVADVAMSGLGAGAAMGDTQAIEKLISAVVKPIDDQWIVFDVDEENKAAMSCISESMEKISSDSFRKKMKDTFDKYPFIKFKKDSKVEERDGIKYYEVEIDKDLAKKFGEEIEATEEFKTLDSCMESSTGGMIKGGTKKTNAKLSAIKEEDDDDTNAVVKLGISSWDHELQAMEVVSTDSDGKTSTMNLSFKVIPEGDVSSAKSVEDLSKDMEGAFKEFLLDYAKTASVDYCKQVEEQYGKDMFYQMFKSQDDCAKQVQDEFEKQMGDMDMSQFLGGLTGGAIQTGARI